MTTIKLRYRSLGAHMHVDVFMGKRVGALALTGTLTMSLEEMKVLARVLDVGSGNARVEVLWDEP